MRTNDKIILYIKHIFFPNKCMCCNKVIKYNEITCDYCKVKLPYTEVGTCLCCGQEVCTCDNYCDYLISSFHYQNGIDTAIIDMKFNNNLLNARKFAEILYKRIEEISFNDKIDIIIPIPMYKKDYKIRGYNQSYEIAKSISKLLNKPIVSNSLIKIKQTKAQHTLSAKDRAGNLENSYIVKNKEGIINKNILLVDDVYTTGTTINYASKLLKEAGVKTVIACVVAKTNVL